MNEIILSKVDFSGLNSLILNLLENNDSSVSALNRLNQTIKQARQVEPELISSDLITMNTVAEIIFTETGKSRIFRLVYPDNVSLQDINLSILTPLGCALLGSKRGQIVPVNTSEGYREVMIKDILFQPEAFGDTLKL